MWLPVTCRNVAVLSSHPCTLTEHLPLRAPPAAQRPSTTSLIPPPVVLQHLRDFTFVGETLSAPQAQHLQQQLAALPTLNRLQLEDSTSLADGLHSTSVTRLSFQRDGNDEATDGALQRVPAQFPNLVALHAPECLALEDGGLEALLSMTSLRHVSVKKVLLARSHAPRACAWEELSLWTLDVDQLARLPLEGIQLLRWSGDDVDPSRDAQPVARVAAAVKRSGGLSAGHIIRFSGWDAAALLTTLRPLLEALPAEEQHRVTIDGIREAATAEVVRQLGQQLPPAVHTLRLSGWFWARNAWAAVLPSLPATVTRLELDWFRAPPQVEEQVLGVCAGAVRPITVSVQPLRDEEQQRNLSQLAQQCNVHVALLFER